ncbi:MAG: sle [Solirubrobacterales bacterium]|jgi:nicotinamidase-related amidase|nr:sle [Solirubrobacterales bacterium]
MAEKLALIVVDVLSDYDHPDAEKLVESVEEVLPRIVELVDDARARDVLTVYVNDNFSDWTLDRGRLLERVSAGPHRRLVEPLAPRDDVAFVLKGRHSIFWETPLAFMLREHGIERLVLCGQVTEQCILYSALDAHVRQFSVTVAQDACATIDPELAEASLTLMERNMHARIVTAAEALEPEGAVAS